jgi:protein-tyrosine phosphatase
MKVLMVCLGNICRSTLAEGILQGKIDKKGLDWEVDSAGTGNWHVGHKPDVRSIAVGKKYGIDISKQKARQITANDLENFDLILAMDKSNYRNIRELAQNDAQLEKVKLIRNFAHPNENLEVPDPYYDDNGFEAVYKMLDEACEVIVK